MVDEISNVSASVASMFSDKSFPVELRGLTACVYSQGGQLLFNSAQVLIIWIPTAATRREQSESNNVSDKRSFDDIRDVTTWRIAASFRLYSTF